MDLVITIIAHGRDEIGEREILLDERVTSRIVEWLAADGIVVDQIDADMPDVLVEP